MNPSTPHKLSRRNFLTVIGATAAGAALLAACGTNTPTAAPTAGTSGGTSQPPAGAAVTVEHWDNMTGIGDETIKKSIEKFQQANPNIKVNRTYKAIPPGTQSSEVLLTAIASGNPPDTNYFDRFIVPQFAAQGFLTEVTDRAQKDGIKSDDYFPFAWEEASYKGKLWALPAGTDTRGLWINEDIAKEVGLDPAKPPQTLKDLEMWMDKMTKKDASGKITRFGFNPIYGQAQLYTWGWMYKGEFFDKATNKVTTSHPKVIEGAKAFKAFADKNGADNLNAFVSACANNQCTSANDYLLTGQIAMAFNGNWMVANVVKFKPEVKYNAVPLPGPDGPAPHGSWAGGWSWVLPKGVKNPEQGWKFINYMATTESTNFIREIGNIPTYKKAAEDKAFRTDPRFAMFMDLLPVSHSRPPIPAGSLLWDELQAARNDIYNNKKTVEQALKDVDDKVNKEMEKYK